jgi:hypothetical protein
MQAQNQLKQKNQKQNQNQKHHNMATNTLDWTHKVIHIHDIRKINNLYIIKIGAIDFPLFVNQRIFEERLNSYFLRNNISREEILNINWNMYITKGHYIKISKEGEITELPKDADKYYISFLEIAGELGGFSSVYHENIENKN